jgi:biotin carboxylase
MKHIVFVESNHAGLAAFPTAKVAGHKVTFIYSPEHAHLYGGEITHPSFASVDHFIPLDDTSDAKQLREALNAAMQIAPIDAAITVSEFCVTSLARAAGSIGVRATRIEAIELCRNKYEMRKFLHEKRIESVRSVVADIQSIESWDKFPAVLKPRSGASSLWTEVVQTRQELQKAFGEISKSESTQPKIVEEVARRHDLIIEEHLSGPMLSVEVLISNDHSMVIAIGARKRSQANEVIELGTMMPAQITDEQQKATADHALRIANALNFGRGALHIEMIYTQDGPRVIEINPRLMGGSLPILFQNVHDMNVYDLLIRSHLDESLAGIAIVPKRFGVSRLFGAETPARIRSDFDERAFQSALPPTCSLTFFAQRGQNVNQLKSNHDYIGRLLLTDSTADTLNEQADRMLQNISNALGVRLAE